ncbi:MAG: alpha/beta hydrolase, partial [Chitinophagales bacterium]
VPIMILHGTKDETVSIHSGKKLQQYLKKGDRFVEIKNGRHNNLDQFNEYHLALDEVLNDDGE